ncbi:Asp23/Gls24 family envelope stress response protein [Carnobacteriaceae bacterium zg-C25]|nr:Asp23/Gls24 family envelope stress response protein [Carnobacteriaceae bacterium zg-C25]
MEKTHNQEVFGNIEISPQAIELIAGIAASKVKQVHSIQGYKKSNSLKSLVSKGVELDLNELGEFIVDIHVAVYYGVEIPKVAKLIQDRIKEQILFMCNIEIKEVNVYIDHLVSEKGEYIG